MGYFISQIDIGSHEGTSSIELAYPTEKSPSAVNILCGLNAAGKSLILEQISKVLKGRKRWQIKAPLVTFSPRPHGQIPILFIGKAWKAKDEAGETNILHPPMHADSIPIAEGEYRRVSRWFLAHQIAEYLPNVGPQLISGAPLPADTVRLVAETLGDGQRIHLCSRNNPLVARLEHTLEGSLYFRCKQKNTQHSKLIFHLVLAFQDGTTVPYERWSDGQRAFFYFLCALHCIRPEIVLYDEPENHQHPALLTQTMEAMKSIPGQYILATHHPHLIFSRHVDRVYYIDTVRPTTFSSPPDEIAYSDRFLEQPLAREITRLEDTFDRINAAYRLFHHHDDQLLRQAAYLEERATLVLLRAIETLYEPRVAEGRQTVLPDTQTQQLSDSIRRVIGNTGKGPVRIVDLGSGVGRQVMEMDKLSIWQVCAEVQWTCYEPNPEYRETLIQRFKTRTDVHIAETCSEIAPGEQHICVISNVLHELTPSEFGSLLAQADRLLVPHTGTVVILELYPLLRPEGFAVPYDSSTLLGILRNSGFSCDASNISLVPCGSTAYCVFARRVPTAGALSSTHVQEQVEKAWEELLHRSLAHTVLETQCETWSSMLASCLN